MLGLSPFRLRYHSTVPAGNTLWMLSSNLTAVILTSLLTWNSAPSISRCRMSLKSTFRFSNLKCSISLPIISRRDMMRRGFCLSTGTNFRFSSSRQMRRHSLTAMVRSATGCLKMVISCLREVSLARAFISEIFSTRMLMNFWMLLLMSAGGTSSPQIGGCRATAMIFNEVQQICSTLSSAFMRENYMRARNRFLVRPSVYRSGSLSCENFSTASTAAARCRQFQECADIHILAPRMSRYSICSYFLSSSGSAVQSPPNSLSSGRMYFSMSASPWLQTQGFLNLQSSSTSVTVGFLVFSTLGFFSLMGRESSSTLSSSCSFFHHSSSSSSSSSNSLSSSSSRLAASSSLRLRSSSRAALSFSSRSLRSWSWWLSWSSRAIISSNLLVSYFSSQKSLRCLSLPISSLMSLICWNSCLAFRYFFCCVNCLICLASLSTVSKSFLRAASLSCCPLLAHSACSLLMSCRVTMLSSSASHCWWRLQPYCSSNSSTFSFCCEGSFSPSYLKQGWPQILSRSMEAAFPCSLSATTILMYLHLPDTSMRTASLKSQTLAREVQVWLSSDTMISRRRANLLFLGWRQSSVTKVRAWSLKRRWMGAMAKSVDSQLMMLRVGRWKICVTVSEKLEAETSSYSTYDIK